MIKKVKNHLKLSIVLGLGSLTLMSCDPKIDDLGAQFFVDGIAEGTTKSYDIVAYNLDHNDTLRTDASKIVQATLGAFNEDNFGSQKSAYVTQLRLSQYAPDFGTNAVVDSVTLEIKPNYLRDSVSVSTTESGKYQGVDAKTEVTTYQIKKYGKDKALTINVHEVTDFLYSRDKEYYSNTQVAEGDLLGTYKLDGSVSAVNISSKEDNRALLSREAAIRIPLNKTFFQKKIVDHQTSADLKDAASFIRYINGIKLSVAENDGYIFNFSPDDVSIKMYYTNDAVDNGTTIRKSSVYSFDLGSSNVHFSQIEYNRPSTYQTIMKSVDKVNGDRRLYLQGMGGAGAVLKIPSGVLSEIKKLYKEDQTAILSAKVRVYTDEKLWNNQYGSPSTFLVKYGAENTFLDDAIAFANSSNFQLVRGYNLDKASSYYDITITQTLKNIIEKEALNRDLEINIGSYLVDSQGILRGQNYNTRAYDPQRLILVGSDKTNENRIKLNIIYAKK